MGPKQLIDGLIMYLGLLVLLTLHEFGHAWTAWRCGDDTARLQGRVSLNPLVHIDLIGTVILPLAMIFLPVGGFLVGWARPVPVNPSNLRHPRRDDLLVTLAGPGMNFLLGIVLMGLARAGLLVHSESILELCANLAHLSLLLGFFNLLPIPPLDGSQVVRTLVGMSYATYYQVARYGFFVLILALQIPGLQRALSLVTNQSWIAIGNALGVPLA